MPKEKTIKVKAIENLSTFMAVDGKLYKLKKGDICLLYTSPSPRDRS